MYDFKMQNARAVSELVSIKKALDILKGVNSIVITSHIHPDGDAIGSSLAMYHALRSMGKSARIVINDAVPKCFSILDGSDSIVRKVDGDADLILLLDTRINRAGGVCEKISAPILNIDHHVSNDGKANWLLLEPEASATCEIVYRLLVAGSISIDKSIAMSLYAGIATDTGFFRFDNTTPDALTIGAELVRLGAEPSVIADSVATKSFRELQLMAAAMQTIETFFDGRVIGIFLDEPLSELESTDELIDLIRFAEGAEIAFLLIYEGRGRYRLRMRSRRLDITRITEALGGGGHKHAAGATIKGTLSDAKRIVLNAIKGGAQEPELIDHR